MKSPKVGIGGVLAVVAMAALAALDRPGPAPRPTTGETSVIVQAGNAATAEAAVRGVGGRVTHALGIIDAVAARMTAPERARLERDGRVRRIYDDGVARVAGPTVDTAYPTLVGAARLHAEGRKGGSVTVAVLDTGFWKHSALVDDSSTQFRVKAQYDVIRHRLEPFSYATGDYAQDVKDESGHGTHVTAVILSRAASGGRYNGVAPDARLVVVKAFNPDGSGTYADVIRGIDWIVAKKNTFGIRVLNCSFSAPVRSRYWEDPINQALMRAWKAGIVVVASAGNTGPNPMSVGVPGNNPYVITVGAMTDNYTPSNGADDRLASFSATGPTYEGFVKPDLVAPGGHMVALTTKDGVLPRTYTHFLTGVDEYFQMSGTSQAAGVVSGVAALMLDADPTLTPDDVKCGLMATARAAASPGGTSPYSVFQQGAGLVDAYGAVHGGFTRCANGGLDIAKDVAGTQHFAGPAAQDANGNYYLMDQIGNGTTWNGGYSKTGGYPWSNGYPWSSGYPWSNGYPWSSGYPWSNGYPWSSGYAWSNGLTQPASVNFWVPQE